MALMMFVHNYMNLWRGHSLWPQVTVSRWCVHIKPGMEVFIRCTEPPSCSNPNCWLFVDLECKDDSFSEQPLLTNEH